MPIFNGTPTLLNLAEHYIRLGYSVIPVHGDLDSDRAKVAAIPWAEFQKRTPTLAELQHWFVEQRHRGLAIVTGSVSGLVVIDFDTHAAFNRFYDRLPALIDTYTVKSRRGHHLYFRLLPGMTLPSRKGQGVDLLGDGKYVVAPPTSINGWTYKITRHVEPYLLSETDIQGILAFFGAAATPTPEPEAAVEFTPFMRVSEGSETDCRTASSHPLTGYELVSRYKYRADSEGRNEALFQMSLMARDHGWSVGDALNCLVDVHVNHQAKKPHRSETNAQRQREATATIHSAYSRPARPCKRNDLYNNAQIPNSVREKLFQTGLTCVVRVLEGLRLTGIEPGQPFTIGEALLKLKGRVGRDSIYHALNAVTPEGQRLFDTLPLRNPNPATADTEQHETHYNKCSVVTPQKSGKNQRGRPAQVFVMPGNLDLCRRLSIRASISDVITLEDLQGAKQTRQAVHRELIKRRPGQYPCRWLARRLGVCPRTLQAYNREIPIRVQPMYLEMPVTWSSLHRIPDDLDVPGTFLEDETGKKYPARRGIAARLLSKGHFVIHKRRSANFYWYGDNPPDRAMLPSRASMLEAKRTQHEIGAQPRPQTRLPAPIRMIDPVPESTSPKTLPPSSAPIVAFVPEAHTRQVTRPKSKRYFRKPLPEEHKERLAKQVHQLTNPDPDRNEDGLSLFNARRLVETYGVGPVEVALKRMAWLRERGKVKNAAGFMVTVSRVMWRVQHGATDLGTPAPRFRGERRREGRRNNSPV